jgi:hypothetical protein
MCTLGLWIFLPVAGLIILIILFVPTAKQDLGITPKEVLQSLPQKLDLLGFALFALAVTMMNLALSWGGQTHPWNSSIVIGLLCGAVVTAGVLIAWLRFRQDQALIPPRIFRKPTVLYGSLLSFLQGGAFIMMGFFLPLWFQSIKQVSPTTSGLMLLPTTICQIIAASLTGVLSILSAIALPSFLRY